MISDLYILIPTLIVVIALTIDLFIRFYKEVWQPIHKTEIDIDYRARIYIHCNGNLYRVTVFQATAWVERQATAISPYGPNICMDVVEAEAMPYDAENAAWNWTGVYTLIAAYELYYAKNDSAAQDAEKSPDKPNPPTTLTNHLTFRRGLTNEN